MHLVLRHCCKNELNSDSAQVQTCLATNQVFAGCEKLLQNVESSSIFATKSVHVARFTDPRQTCFAASDVTPVYGVTPAKFIQSEVSIQRSFNNLMCCKIERFY